MDGGQKLVEYSFLTKNRTFVIFLQFSFIVKHQVLLIYFKVDVTGVISKQPCVSVGVNIHRRTTKI